MKRTSLNGMEPQPVLLSVQYLRALAALLVLLAHASLKARQYSHDPMRWYHVGASGVDLFFVISGFIMCHVTAGRQKTVAAFLKDRAFRILPLYWSLTALMIPCYLVFPDKINSSGGTTSVLHSFTLLPSDSKYLIQNGWTLSYEFLFYFIFCASLLTKSRLRLLIPPVLLCLCVLAGRCARFVHPGWNFVTSTLLLEFAMGIAAFALLSRVRLGNVFAVLLLACGVMAITVVNLTPQLIETGDRTIVFGLPMVLIFTGIVGLEPHFLAKEHSRFSRLCKLLGDSSYSLYLVHPAVLVLTSLLLKSLGITRLPVIFVTVLIVVGLISGIALYRGFEAPVLSWTKTIRRKHSPPQIRTPAPSPARVS